MLIRFIAQTATISATAALLAICTGCKHTQAAPQARPPIVQVAKVSQKTVPIYGDWVATLQGYVNAQIQPHVTGYLIRQNYREGSYVQKGSVLFEIDPRPFQASLDQAKGQLAEAEAQLGNAALNVKRDIPEAKAQAIPKSQLETDTQAKLAAEAAVAAAKAAVEQAQLNLGYTKVRSLVGGIAGIAQVQVGNLVSPTTVLTSVSQVDPIKAYFPITGNEYLAIVGEASGSNVNLLSAKKRVPLELTLSNGTRYQHDGTILFTNRQIDPETGTIQIVGSFPNPRRILRPGQTGRVRAMTELRTNALLVPQRAVTQLQSQYEVAIVGQDNQITIRHVQVGPQVGSDWVINQGLKAGDRVVAEGMEKVRDGMKVTPQPYVSPESTPQTEASQTGALPSSGSQRPNGGY